MTYTVVQLIGKDIPWASQLLTGRWGSPGIVSRGTLHTLEELQGFIAKQTEKPVGLVTYRIHGNQCEIVSLDSPVEKQGVGTALIEAVKREAPSKGCTRLWTITTNDNIEALRFWQKRGFALVAVHRNALEVSRKLKPQIPLIGNHGIPLRDEIELELLL